MRVTRRVLTLFSALIISWLSFSGTSWAAPNPNPSATSSATSGVSGTFTIPSQLTVTLSASSFNVSGNDGQTYTVPTPVITANVQTNDNAGYQLLNMIGSNGFSAGAAQIPNSAITPLSYPGGPTTTPSFNSATGNFGNGFTQVVAFTNTYSANGGDTYNQQWQFVIPGNQPAGQYNGTITVIALGN